MAVKKSIYQFQIEGLDGEEIDFGQFKGKLLLIVNTASECGYTYQYGQLQELYDMFKDKINILGVPSNDFGNQEPGKESEIQAFCEKNFQLSFPVTKKLKVLGEDRHPLYEFLCNGDLNGFQDSEMEWNFQKFLFDEKGRLCGVYSPATEPNSPTILEVLTKEPKV
ncbi:MAG: glutathione peroxidase [Chitinophagaceae bacterium]|nr:MAG: glutathione peroxidase [Chitinophagaceae bacterium]